MSMSLHIFLMAWLLQSSTPDALEESPTDCGAGLAVPVPGLPHAPPPHVFAAPAFGQPWPHLWQNTIFADAISQRPQEHVTQRGAA